MSNPTLAYSNPAGGHAVVDNAMASPATTTHNNIGYMGSRGVSVDANIKMAAEGQQQRPKTAGVA